MPDSCLLFIHQNIDFVTLSEFEDKVKAYDRISPLMPESAGVYGLLKENPLFQEIYPEFRSE